ncbi:MAG: leucine-rich repeat domain-containing protein [Kiritimatiellia bacterium]
MNTGIASRLCAVALALLGAFHPHVLPADTFGPYTYTIYGDEAVITGFDVSYADALSITNELGGHPVTAIDHAAFEGCESLSSVTIPNSVTNIYQGAFYGCTALTNITASADNQDYASVDGVLFNKNRTMLVQYPGGLAGPYTIPDSVISISNLPFAGCSSLTSLTIGSDLAYITYWTFRDCSSLTNITVSANNPNYASVGGALFDKDLTLLIRCPGGLSGSYVVPDSVIAIENYAFLGCSALTNILFLGDAPGVGLYVFYDTPAKFHYLPGSTGWSSSIFGGAVCWNPKFSPASRPSFIGGAFAFSLIGNVGIPVRIEASDSLAAPSWSTVTNTMIPASGTRDFTDPDASAHPSRFYRIAFPQ